MLLCGSEGVQGRDVEGISSGFSVQLFANAADVLRLTVDDGEHSAEEEEVARLYCLDVGAKRRRRSWEVNAKVLQPAFCTSRLRTLTAHHRPVCAPPSTCSTSPVT